MSILNDIQLLLDIQDKNLKFKENCIEKGTHKGKACTYVAATLTYTPTSCEVCHVSNDNYTVYKNGTQLSRITLPVTGVHPTYLVVKKQRFKCKQCGSSFTAKTPVVQRHCHISLNTKAQIVVKSVEAQSLTSIARDCSVSPTTVQRVINTVAKQYKGQHTRLPKHLSFDEFKYAKGQMAFEYIDVVTGDIIDILPQRTKYAIKNHFLARYSLAERNQVETVTIDMNAGYHTVIQELFPNASIIIDRFHIIQLINRSMNQIRIRVMNQFRTSSGEDMKRYRRLKRHWKLLLKHASDLSSSDYKYYPLFGQRTARGIIEELLSYDEILRENYNIYQKLLSAFKKRSFKEFSAILTSQEPPLIYSYMKTSLKTLRKYSAYIKNSFTYTYNNGRIEGINNKIKVLNRVAYGYRNFSNYKNRILLHFKLRPTLIK